MKIYRTKTLADTTIQKFGVRKIFFVIQQGLIKLIKRY